jgi:hypothetical protein
MKKLIYIAVMVALAACSNETSTSTSVDSTCCDSMSLTDSVNLDQVERMDSLHAEGKL